MRHIHCRFYDFVTQFLERLQQNLQLMSTDIIMLQSVLSTIVGKLLNIVS